MTNFFRKGHTRIQPSNTLCVILVVLVLRNLSTGVVILEIRILVHNVSPTLILRNFTISHNSNLIALYRSLETIILLQTRVKRNLTFNPSHDTLLMKSTNVIHVGKHEITTEVGKITRHKIAYV